MAYVVVKNKWGGFEVVDGKTRSPAPRPNGYNNQANALKRAQVLNAAASTPEEKH